MPMLHDKVVLIDKLVHHLHCCTLVPLLFDLFFKECFGLLSQLLQLSFVLHHDQLLVYLLQLL